VLKKLAMVVAAAGSMFLATAAKADLVLFPLPAGAAFATIGSSSTTSGPDTLAVTIESAVYAPGFFSFAAMGYTGPNILAGAPAAGDWVYVYQFSVDAGSNVAADHFSVGVGSDVAGVGGGKVDSMGIDTQDLDGVKPSSSSLTGTSSDWFYTAPKIFKTTVPAAESVVMVLTSPLSPDFGSATAAQGVATNVFPVLVPAAAGTVPFPLPRASFGLIGLMVLFGGARLVRNRRNLAL